MKPERQILDACLAHLGVLEGIQRVDFTDRNRRLAPEIDGKLTLGTRAGQFAYVVETKGAVTQAGLEHLIQQMQRTAKAIKDKPILLTDYVSPKIADRLIGAGVNFADAAGNVYLNWPGRLHIQIQGKKPSVIAESRSERLSQPSGLKILYVLLTQPPENWGTYRDISKAAGVALGSVAVVTRELKTKGYLTEKNRGQWGLTQKRKLLDLWVQGYDARLRPDLLIGKYQPREANLEQTLHSLQNELKAGKISWSLTGGFAADKLTHHFRGEQLCFYTEDWPRDIARKLQWLPSDRGTVTVLRKFSPLVTFQTKAPDSEPIAHPLLVYAELMFQSGERELETARLVYDRSLSPLVEENGR